MTIALKYVSDEEDYFDNFIIDKIKKNKGMICYITFNKSYDSLKDVFIKKKFNIERFYFIDGVTKLLAEPYNTEKCRFIHPYEINTMEDYVIDFIKKGCNLVIFDSLSNLIIHQQMLPAGTGLLVKFIESINHELMKKGGEAIFICKLKDENNLLIEETVQIFKHQKF